MSRITSNAAEPGPTTMPARSSVTGTPLWRKISPVRRRAARCGELSSFGCSAPKDHLFDGGIAQCVAQVFRRLALLLDKIVAVAHRVHQIVKRIDLPQRRAQGLRAIQIGIQAVDLRPVPLLQPLDAPRGGNLVPCSIRCGIRFWPI